MNCVHTYPRSLSCVHTVNVTKLSLRYLSVQTQLISEHAVDGLYRLTIKCTKEVDELLLAVKLKSQMLVIHLQNDPRKKEISV